MSKEILKKDKKNFLIIKSGSDVIFIANDDASNIKAQTLCIEAMGPLHLERTGTFKKLSIDGKSYTALGYKVPATKDSPINFLKSIF